MAESPINRYIYYFVGIILTAVALIVLGGVDLIWFVLYLASFAPFLVLFHGVRRNKSSKAANASLLVSFVIFVMPFIIIFINDIFGGGVGSIYVSMLYYIFISPFVNVLISSLVLVSIDNKKRREEFLTKLNLPG